jgi:hypothetical protein
LFVRLFAHCSIADKKLRQGATQRFYGPQIPVPWAEDRLAAAALQRRKTRAEVEEDGDEDEGGGGGGYHSPTEEVEQLLAQRQAGGPNSNLLDEEARDTQYTQAYLKSRYSGSLQPKQPVVQMLPAKPGESRDPTAVKITPEEAAFEFLGPQLQPDWLENADRREVRHKNQALRMDLVSGRERLKMHAKGQREVVPFNSRTEPSEEMGPGYYDTGSRLDMAVAAKEKSMGLPFSKAIARQDQVGAFGERPAAAVEVDRELLGAEDGDLYFLDDGQQLDLDAARAKDAQTDHLRNKSFQLYQKDRFKEPKPSGLDDDHLGGSWFEGMADQIAKGRPGAGGGGALEFSKMTGRPAAAERALEEEVLAEIAGPVAGQIDLEVKDWRPHAARADPGYVMRDPKKHPRFDHPKPAYEKPFDPDAPIEPLPNYDYIKGGKDPLLVNMDKMTGRADFDREAEQTILQELEGGRVDARGAYLFYFRCLLLTKICA